jgi:hypothetical protein
MTAECHDPVNNRTLDVSGNGLHFRFGDGATANTFPTKLATRGYSFNGTTNYLEALANQTNPITEGTWAIAALKTSVLGFASLYYHQDGVGNTRASFYIDGPHTAFYCGNAVNNTYILNTVVPRQLKIMASIRTTDGYRRMWANDGLNVPNNAGNSVPSTVVTTNPRIGAGSVGPFSGRILWYGHWEYALSEIQLRDLEARLRRQINDV